MWQEEFWPALSLPSDVMLVMLVILIGKRDVADTVKVTKQLALR